MKSRSKAPFFKKWLTLYFLGGITMIVSGYYQSVVVEQAN
jgi:hypothetical protein